MSVQARRILFLGLVTLTIISLLTIMSLSMLPNGIDPFEAIMLTCFAITLPWTAIGFWNAVIGFILMRVTKNPAHHVFPALASTPTASPINTSTAILSCIRNEDVKDVEIKLTAMIGGLVKAGVGDKFKLYILSDTSEDSIAHMEEKTAHEMKQKWAGKFDIVYRRRAVNKDFKSGNIRDFCENWGDNHDYMLVLDADSVMTVSAILRLVRTMQENNKIGLIQSLVVGLPSNSLFTRIFQFGMRQGMSSYTLGSAWWQADCGPYWGHNALIRIEPFKHHCHMPTLSGKGPLSGSILSHDQVEAVMMRRAGYECRVIADEAGSWEENPPELLEFIRRDLRWCHGNMQYVKLLNMPGIRITSRIQLLLAILMFAGSPAWMTFVITATLSLGINQATFAGLDMGIGLVLFAIIMSMIFAPKLATMVDVLITKEKRDSYGGAPRFLIGVLGETIFSMLVAPIMAIATTMFLAGLPFGKAKAWPSQVRKAQSLPVGLTIKRLWSQTLFGIFGVASLASFKLVTLAGLFVSLPVFTGPFIAIGFAIFTASPALGRLATRMQLWSIPEEVNTPAFMHQLDLPALSDVEPQTPSVQPSSLGEGTQVSAKRAAA